MKSLSNAHKLIAVSIAALVVLAGAGVANAADQIAKRVGSVALGFEETRAIAEEGFIYGLPIVMNYTVMNEFVIDENSGQFKAPFNVIKSVARVFTYEDTAVVTPNSDTPYSSVWLDLRAEPVVISVPAVEKQRYYSVQLVDGSSYNYGYIGTRATGTQAGDYLIVGPNWKGETPAGIKKVFQSSTPFSLTIFRTQLFSADDMPNVEKVQAGYRAQPLSTYLKMPAPPAAPKIDFLPASTKGIKENFYQYLDAALQFVPETSDDREIRARLASIGIGPAGKAIAAKGITFEHKAALLLGMKSGADKVSAFVAEGGVDQSGWQVGGLAGGDRAFFNGDWLKRAATAKAGIYANDPAEAVYPATRKDLNGQTLDTGKHDYTLTFAAGELPPVNAFWSVTMYDGNTQLLIKNSINRYLINSPMLSSMAKNADGSVTLYIQKTSPGKDREANWLPAPNGPVYLVMRLYWPTNKAPSILPLGEGTWEPPGILAVK